MFEFYIPGESLPPFGVVGYSNLETSNESSEVVGLQSFYSTFFTSENASWSLLNCGLRYNVINHTDSGQRSFSVSNSSSFVDGGSSFTVVVTGSSSESYAFESGSTGSTEGLSTTNISSSALTGTSEARNGGRTTVSWSTGGGGSSSSENSGTPGSTTTSGNNAFSEVLTTTEGFGELTTTTESVNITITSYDYSTFSTSALTGFTSSYSDSNSQTVTYWTTGTTETTVEQPYSTWTSLSGEDTVTETVTAEVTVSTLTFTDITVTLDEAATCKDNITRYEADPCNRLYYAGPVVGIVAFCDAFQSAESVDRSHAYTTTELVTSEEGPGSEYVETTYAYGLETTTTDGFPETFQGSFNVFVPDSLPGYQPYSALGVSDDVYESYTIVVPPTLDTDTPEYSSRTDGLTFGRGNITQVLTLNSEDSISLGSVVGTQSVGGKGGWGWIPGAGTAIFSPGVFNITMCSSDGNTSSEQSTFNASLTVTLIEGVVYAISAEIAVSDGGAWPAGEEQIFVMELPCEIL